MAAFEGSQKNMLQGVSQQLQRERLEGQVSAQVNMLSDLVTGLRRRPGSEVRTAWQLNGADPRRMVAWDTDINGQRVRFVIDGVTGVLRIADQNWGIITSLQSPYFVFTDRSLIQNTTSGDKVFVLNKGVVPYIATRNGGVGSTKFGYFFIKAGAFQTTYTITIGNNTGYTRTASYTTPAATVEGAATQSTPEFIAQKLQEQLVDTPASRLGSYVFIDGVSPAFTVTSGNSQSYVGVSGTSRVQTIADLPARLPPGTGAYTIAVGAQAAPAYYKWNDATTSWLETAAENSAATLGGMPVAISVTNAGVWSLASTYEGRLAGDDKSNPDPGFLGYGIDGIGSFQGRLVILHGSRVSMSASNNPARFYRSTIESLLAADPIEVGASANSSAAYEYCVPFNKDLLLFSEKYQALVPGGGSVLSPQTASVVVTSTYTADMTSAPLALGRTVVYPAPRSKDFYGMMEMLPSPYTDSQYVSADMTAHLPKYLNGRCRFSVSSSVSGMALFASTTDLRVLAVHEYTWNGDEKAQQAWHKWVFPYDIADAFFTGSEINLLFVNNGQLVVAVIDPRIGTLTEGGERRPFLDCYIVVPVVKTDPDPTIGGYVDVPSFYQLFDSSWHSKVKLADRSAEMMGEEVGLDRTTTARVFTMPSFGTGQVSMGIPFRSSISPSMPSIKDSNGVVISSNKLTILRFMVGTANSSEFEAIVSDSSDESADNDDEMATLYWGAADLDINKARVSKESISILPCRTNAVSTTVVLFTDGLGDLNIVSLEYVCRYNQKLKRR